MASTADAQHRAVKITGIRLLSQLPVEVEWYTFLQHNVEYKNYKSRSITHTHTHLFNGPFSGTTRVGRYQKGKTNLDFTEARDSE